MSETRTRKRLLGILRWRSLVGTCRETGRACKLRCASIPFNSFGFNDWECRDCGRVVREDNYPIQEIR